MVFCIQVTVALPDDATRQQVRSRLIEERDALERWGADMLTVTRLRSGEFGLIFEARFMDRAEAEQAWVRARNFIDARAPLAGSRMIAHTCTHDEDSNDCVEVARREW